MKIHDVDADKLPIFAVLIIAGFVIAGCRADVIQGDQDFGRASTILAAPAVVSDNLGSVLSVRPFDDWVSGIDSANSIDGLADDETILGGPGNDLIDADDPNALLIPNPAPPGPDFHPADMGWTLSWSDEFDGDTLDSEKWLPEISCWGGGNNEKQCYTGRSDNVQVVNGLLRLIAQKEDFVGPSFPPEWNDPAPQNAQPYTSGKVRTRGLADWRYARIEVRAKLPRGQGTWPAIWMMPIENFYGTWPLSGEIDVMEAVNLGARCNSCSGSAGENHTSAALHFGDLMPGNKFITRSTSLPGDSHPADGYHVWAVEWGEGLIHFFLNGELYFTVRNDEWFTTASTNPNAPFDRAFYLMANLAIGGNLPEPRNDMGISPDAIPNELLIDWVRVYQCADDMEFGRACMAGR